MDQRRYVIGCYRAGCIAVFDEEEEKVSTHIIQDWHDEDDFDDVLAVIDDLFGCFEVHAIIVHDIQPLELKEALIQRADVYGIVLEFVDVFVADMMYQLRRVYIPRNKFLLQFVKDRVFLWFRTNDFLEFQGAAGYLGCKGFLPDRAGMAVLTSSGLAPKYLRQNYPGIREIWYSGWTDEVRRALSLLRYGRVKLGIVKGVHAQNFSIYSRIPISRKSS